MSVGASVVRVLGWPARRLGLQRLSALAAFLAAAAILARVGWFYAHRTIEPLYTDRLLTNYFAYYQDLVVAPLFLLFPLAFCWWRGRGRPAEPVKAAAPLVAGLAVVVLVGCYAGARLLFQGYGLSIDEHMADFDAKILASGRLFAPVPPEWRTMLDALEPNFIFRTTDGSLWSSSYLPGNAALRALIGLLADRDWTSPLLAAGSVLLLYGVARKLEPKERSFGFVAVLLLVSSSQFLITAMTPYAMSAHLALNLAWLWCVLDDRRCSRAGAVATSFLACGLHQVIFHPLFVAPFLPWLWFSGRRWQAAFYAVSVAVFALFWINYWSIALALVAPDKAIAGLLHVPLVDRIEALLTAAGKPIAAIMSADNLLRLLTWQNPLLWPLVAAAAVSLRRSPSIVWPLLGGILLTFAAMLLLMPQQGHGWGYRYLHGLLGNFALLGAMGWRHIARGLPAGQPHRALLPASLALSLLLLLPIRIQQAHGFANPYLIADSRIAASAAEVVIIDHTGRWFANDLVRNDPFLRERPVRLLAAKLRPRESVGLCQRNALALHAGSTQLSAIRQIGRSPRQSPEHRIIQAFTAIGCRNLN